jgi:cobyrinic acid a,c-diamide synthase
MEQVKKYPRLVIAGSRSGTGKTTITTGILSVLTRRGHRVQGFKVGPDYIDPGFHELASGKSSYNLDTWLVPPEKLTENFCRLAGQSELSIIEGVMGLYDGGSGGISSTAQIAEGLKAPVILVIDCRSVGESAAAEALGYRLYHPELCLAGVILNRLGSDRHESIIRHAMEQLHMPVLGAFHREEELVRPERHLGLVPVKEEQGMHAWLDELTRLTEKSMDWDGLLSLADRATSLPVPDVKKEKKETVIRVALAQDEAFSFFYPADRQVLEERGVELIPFSPLRDRTVPEADALILSGGFPEMFLPQLSGNQSMMESIRQMVRSGRPVYAECGGYMTLCEKITDLEGRSYDMAGVIPAVSRMNKKLKRVGYVEAQSLSGNILFSRGDRVHGHEFHFSEIEPLTDDFPAAYEVKRAGGGETWKDGYARENVLASYVHLSWSGQAGALERFISMALKGKK